MWTNQSVLPITLYMWLLLKFISRLVYIGCKKSFSLILTFNTFFSLLYYFVFSRFCSSHYSYWMRKKLSNSLSLFQKYIIWRWSSHDFELEYGGDQSDGYEKNHWNFSHDDQIYSLTSPGQRHDPEPPPELKTTTSRRMTKVVREWIPRNPKRSVIKLIKELNLSWNIAKYYLEMCVIKMKKIHILNACIKAICLQKSHKELMCFFFFGKPPRRPLHRWKTFHFSRPNNNPTAKMTRFSFHCLRNELTLLLRLSQWSY